VYQSPMSTSLHTFNIQPTLKSLQMTASLNNTTLTRNATHKLISLAVFHANLWCHPKYLSVSNTAPLPTVCHIYSSGPPQNDIPRMFTSKQCDARERKQTQLLTAVQILHRDPTDGSGTVLHDVKNLREYGQSFVVLLCNLLGRAISP